MENLSNLVEQEIHRCILCKKPGCVKACPLHNRIPEWMIPLREGRLEDARAILASTNPIPELCSRLCPVEKLCERGCVFFKKGTPIQIQQIEKFISEIPEVLKEPNWNGRKIAVVGAGPSGLAAAEYCAKQGYLVTVYERDMAGGAIASMIPELRFQKQYLESWFRKLNHYHIQIINKELGKDFQLAWLKERYDAVYLALGTYQNKVLKTPGITLPGVYYAYDFLRELKKILVKPHQRVAIIGGGNVAIDCALACKEEHISHVEIIYRRSLEQAPATKGEYAFALEHGICFSWMKNPIEIQQKHDKLLVKIEEMVYSDSDQDGRLGVIGSKQYLEEEFDFIVFAIGNEPDYTMLLGENIKMEQHKIVVDESHMTSLEGVFVGGDFYEGPTGVARAAKAGLEVAEAMIQFLKEK